MDGLGFHWNEDKKWWAGICFSNCKLFHRVNRETSHKHKKLHCLGNWRIVNEANAPGQLTKRKKKIGPKAPQSQKDPNPVTVIERLKIPSWGRDW